MIITGITREVSGESSVLGSDELAFCGKQAGICYMKESYFDSVISEKAMERFRNTLELGHHSIADHVKITAYLENVPKTTAMILNSLQDYCTSEKSGRYTRLNPGDAREQELYEKWTDRFRIEIARKYPDLDGKLREKLSMENARYMLSVFTPVSMSYTTSLRQWNYIADWIQRFREDHSGGNTFFQTVSDGLGPILEGIRSSLHVEGLRDIKNRGLSFFRDEEEYRSRTQILGDVYQVKYRGSFVQLAQAQRHRTLRYQMCFDGHANEFYVPPLLRGTDLEDEWLQDLESVSDRFPQATRVGIIESGHASDFELKAAERLCGRAQLEIMNQTLETGRQLSIANGEKAYPLAKCQQLRTCKEPCFFGAAGAFARII